MHPRIHPPTQPSILQAIFLVVVHGKDIKMLRKGHSNVNHSARQCWYNHKAWTKKEIYVILGMHVHVKLHVHL